MAETVRQADQRPGASRFLNPTVLASISNLELRAKAVVEGFLNGLHKSPYRGFSVEFTDYRPYHRGDDIRHIDWKLYARSDKHYIKQYEDETNLCCHLLVDCSASMGYQSHAVSKLEFAKTLASALAYFMMGQRDAVGLLTFDETIQEHLPARYRKAHLMQILSTLAQVKLGEKTNLMRPISDLAFSLNRKSLLILISDLLDEEDSMVRSLKHLRFKGNDVIVFHVLDPAELTFPFEQIAEFEDLESHERLATVPRAIRETYLAELEKFCALCRRQCQIHGIDYQRLNTAEPLDVALSSYLTKRAKSF